MKVTAQSPLSRTLIKRTQVTVYTERGDSNEMGRSEKERILGLGSTMVETNIKRRIQFSSTNCEQFPNTKNAANRSEYNPEKK